MTNRIIILGTTKTVLTNSIMTMGLFFVLLANSYAVNLQYLRYSPVSSFNAKDFEIFQTTGLKALDSSKDGITIEWHNSETNNSGKITPFDSSTIDGKHCRKVKIVNQSKNQYGESIFTFCKVKGDWKILK